MTQFRLAEARRFERLFSDYFVWSDGQRLTISAGVRARVVLAGKTIRVSDGSGRVVSEVATTDPFADVKRVLTEVAKPPFRAWGYLGFGLAGFRYPYPHSVATELHLIVPEVMGSVEADGMVVEGDDDAVERVRAALTSLPKMADEPLDLSAATAAVDAIEQGRATYETQVEEVRRAIRDGQVGKVILSRQVVLPGRLDPLASFAALAQTQAARRYAFRLGAVSGVGACPEVLLVADANRVVMTNPLAGTQPRGKTPEEDARLRAHLLRDTKEVSEHAASIRLAYDEIASVCTVDSARVVDFMRVKQYPFTQHLSSRAVGTLEAGRSAWDALRAVFPGVTATGIEKEQALAWIAKLEPTPRGVYSGAVGWVDDVDAMDWGIALRSAFDYGEGITLRAGAGIVLDSDPAYEFDESSHKMRTMASRVVIKGRA